MWALIPFKQEDWIKNVKTQERPWGEQEKSMWNVITSDANIDENEHSKEEKDEGNLISKPTSFQHLMNEKILTPSKADILSMKRNKFVRYTENEDYIILRPILFSRVYFLPEDVRING